MSEAETITELQRRVAEMEREMEALNAIVTGQASAMAAMDKRLNTLIGRFLAVEERTADAIRVDKPPHW